MLTDFSFHSQWENKEKAKTELLIQAKLQQTFQEDGKKEFNVLGLVTHPASFILLDSCV